MYEESVGFGGRLKLAVERCGGLAGAARRIEDALGVLAPSRGTYQSLYTVESVENLSKEQRFRAFLLLVAVGLDPEAWLVTPVDVPPALDIRLVMNLVPTTIQDAQALAATGAPGDIQIVRSETAPYQGCSRPNYYGIVSPNITGQALAADELDAMEQHMGLDAECPGYLFLFHTVAESTQGGYTAGAVIEDDSTLSVYTDGLGSSAAFNISY